MAGTQKIKRDYNAPTIFDLVEKQRYGSFFPGDWQWRLEFVGGHLHLRIHQGDTVFRNIPWNCRTVSFERAESFLKAMFGIEPYRVGEEDSLPESPHRTTREAYLPKGKIQLPLD